MTTDIESLVALGEGITPGNWMAAGGPSSIVGWPIVGTALGRSIASVSWMPGLPDELVAEIRANARAIAAVPDLIAAIRTLQTEKAELREALSRIAAFDDGEHMADDVWDELMDLARQALSNTGEME